MTDISLATAQKDETPALIPAGSGTKYDMSDLAQPGLDSTGGRVEYPFRVDIPGVSVSDDTAGTVLWTIALDGEFDDISTQMKSMFVEYRIMGLIATFRAVSPFSTASGSAQVAISPDPENPISDDADTAIKQVMRLLGSKQLSSKSELCFHAGPRAWDNGVVPSQWRYCKRAGTRRLEEFGFLGCIVRSQPAQGDGAVWACTLAGTLEFRDCTVNIDDSVFRNSFDLSTQTLNYTIEPGTSTTALWLLQCEGTTDLPPSAGTAIIPGSIRGAVSIKDATTDYEEGYPIDFNTCSYVIVAGDAGVNTITFLTEIATSRNTDITEPVISDSGVTITSGSFAGYLLYQASSDESNLLRNSIETTIAQSFENYKSKTRKLLPPKRMRNALYRYTKLIKPTNFETFVSNSILKSKLSLNWR